MGSHKANPYEKGTERWMCWLKRLNGPSHKANPYEKGTESTVSTEICKALAILTKLIPMKRELKAAHDRSFAALFFDSQS